MSARPEKFPLRLALALFAPAAAAYVLHFRDEETVRFAHPYLLALVPLAVVAISFLAVRRGAERRATMVHARAAELVGHRRGAISRLAALPLVLRLLGVSLAGVALARPQAPRPDDALELEGIDIMLVLDVSGSMEDTDLVPNRIEAAKDVIRDFVLRRPSDRIGLVIFGRDAYTYVPLTLDHGTLLRMLADLQLGMIDGKGTAIGNGLGVGLARLRKSDAKSKVVILLTDGDNNAGNISPLAAADIAQKLKVRVYTILAGRNDSADEAGGRQRYPVNPKLLEEIAARTGGTPYLATDTRALRERFQQILEDLDTSRLQDRGVLHAELYPSFLFPAFGLLVLEILLRLTRFARLP